MSEAQVAIEDGVEEEVVVEKKPPVVVDLGSGVLKASPCSGAQFPVSHSTFYIINL